MSKCIFGPVCELKVLFEVSSFVSVFPQIHKLQQDVSSNAFWYLPEWLYTHSLLELKSLNYLLSKPFEHTIARLGGSWLVAAHNISSGIMSCQSSLRVFRNFQNRDGWCHRFTFRFKILSNIQYGQNELFEWTWLALYNVKMIGNVSR